VGRDRRRGAGGATEGAAPALDAAALVAMGAPPVAALGTGT
jgi:hypothetical protein